MKKSINAQRPGERKQEIKKRAGVQHERVPLRQERQAAVVQRIPKRHLAAPETLPMVKRQRVPKISKVPEKESCQSKDYLRKSSKNGPGQNQCHPARGETDFIAGTCAR